LEEHLTRGRKGKEKERERETETEGKERETEGEASKDVKFNTACHVNWYKPTWVTINK
jgi:hypothetical protein